MMSDDEWFERPGDELEDDEYPDEDDLEDEFSETLPCPQCGTEIYEDAVRCPMCGTYVTFERRPWSGRPPWWMILGLLAALVTILALALIPSW